MSIEAMKLALEACKGVWNGGLPFHHVERMGKAIKALEEALAKQEQGEQKDAARYQWLRNPTIDVSLVLDKRTEWVEPDENVAGVGGYWMYEYRAGEELDAAIDAAIEATHGIKE